MSLIFIFTVWVTGQLTAQAYEQFYIPHSPFNLVCQHHYEWFYLPDAAQYYPPPPKLYNAIPRSKEPLPIPLRAVTDFGQNPPHKPKDPIKPGKPQQQNRLSEQSQAEEPSEFVEKALVEEEDEPCIEAEIDNSTNETIEISVEGDVSLTAGLEEDEE